MLIVIVHFKLFLFLHILVAHGLQHVLNDRILLKALFAKARFVLVWNHLVLGFAVGADPVVIIQLLLLLLFLLFLLIHIGTLPITHFGLELVFVHLQEFGFNFFLASLKIEVAEVFGFVGAFGMVEHVQDFTFWTFPDGELGDNFFDHWLWFSSLLVSLGLEGYPLW